MAFQRFQRLRNIAGGNGNCKDRNTKEDIIVICLQATNCTPKAPQCNSKLISTRPASSPLSDYPEPNVAVSSTRLCLSSTIVLQAPIFERSRVESDTALLKA